MRVGRRARAALALAIAAACAGCFLPIPFLPHSPVKLRGYAVSAAQSANDRSPVAVDLVIVTDETLVKPVSKLTAADWFAGKGQLLLDNPRGLAVTSMEPVPGQALPYQRLRWKGTAQAAFVFAAYPSKGDHRVRVDPYPWIAIQLTDDSMAVVHTGRP